MLTAFSAQPLIELRQRDKSRIESVLAYGDKVIVGLNTGALRIYRVKDPSTLPEPSTQSGDDAAATHAPTPTKSRLVDLMREEEKFSKRPIQQLALIKEASVLVSLSDGHVSLHDLQTYAFQERLERTRGAALFAVTSNIVKDETTGIPSIVSRLAVAVKRKILLWSWQDMEITEETTELSYVAAVKSITWATGETLMAGLDSGFVLTNIKTAEMSDIMKPAGHEEIGSKFGAVNSTGMSYMGMGGWVPKPMATKLSEGQLLLAKDVNTLFIDQDGKPFERRQVPWPQAPEAVGYSYPFMLALQPSTRGALEIRNPETLSLLQSISLPNASILHVPQPNISLAHAGKGFLVGSERVIWRMTALEYNSQIEDLVSQKLYDEAISLISMLEDTLLLDKEERLRQIKMMKAQTLFDQRKYRDSLELFADATAPPYRVISLYPRTIAGELSIVDGKDSAPEEESAPPEEPEQSSEGKQEVKKEGKQEGKQEAKKEVPTSPKSTPRKGGMLGMFRADPKKPDSDTASIRSSKHAEASESSAGAKRGSDPQDLRDKPLEGRELLFAVNELCAFLAQTRVRLQKILNTDGSLKTPLPTNPPPDYTPDFHHLIVRDADSTDIDWHAALLDVATMVDTTLFRAYMLARPGLAGPLFRLDNFCDPAVVRDKLYETGRYTDLIDFLHGKKLHREALELLRKFGQDDGNEDISPTLRGPQRTVAYLQQLPPELIELILEFAEWPLRGAPDVGMEVFVADTENAEMLPRARVQQYLTEIDVALEVRYLEHVIEELNDLTPAFHQRLIDLYLERGVRGKKQPEDGGFTNAAEREEWKGKLEEFLAASEQYNRARVFGKLPSDDPDFYESRAIVLRKLGQHKQALQIYVFQLHDYARAEEYCNSIYMSTHDPSSTLPSVPTAASDKKPADSDDVSVYHTLLSLYLTPPAPHTPLLDPALALLANHGARLPASQTLSLIPASLPIATLESYFTGRIRTANSVLYSERIVAQLRAVEQARVEEQFTHAKNRRVVVTDERLCPVCMRRFGGSAVRVYPDGRVVHYGCFSKQGEGRSGGSWGRKKGTRVAG